MKALFGKFLKARFWADCLKDNLANNLTNKQKAGVTGRGAFRSASIFERRGTLLRE